MSFTYKRRPTDYVYPNGEGYTDYSGNQQQSRARGGLGGMFDAFNFGMPNFGGGGGFKNPIGWNNATGLRLGKYGVGTGLTALNAGMQGFEALGNLRNISKLNDTSGDIQADIINASNSNPMLQYDLNADQLKLLRDLKNDRYEVDTDLDLMGILGDVGKGALMGAPGGWIGAAVGGIGGGLNSVLGDISGSKERANAELEALYQAMLQSEQNYKEIEKQKAYARLMR